MKLPGWCQRCHRVRQVTPEWPMAPGCVIGTCDECQKELDNEASV